MALRLASLTLIFFLASLTAAARAQISSSEIEGEYEIKFDFRKNFALDKSNRDDLFRFDQELQLRWLYRYDDWLSVLLEGQFVGEHQLYTGGGPRRSEFDPERGETWVRFDKLFGRNLSFTIGRQSFEEPRRWWWDEELDAVNVRYRPEPWLFELGVARELFQESLRDNSVDPEQSRVIRVLARAKWAYLKNHGLDFFFLHENDRSATPARGATVKEDREDPSDGRLWWTGLRASGIHPARYGNLSYWFDLAGVLGREKLLEFDELPGNRLRVTSRSNHRVRGWAIDLGGRWESQLAAEPVFILAYARGSGDKRPTTGIDRSFRQTGLEADDEQFRTYGELLRPELSNLRIPTFAVQFPILWRSYIEFAYRNFRQVHAAPFLRGEARIEAEPNGISRNIGHEWMLYSIIRQWKNIEIELVGAAFRAGRAYGPLSGKMAYSLFTQVTFEF